MICIYLITHNYNIIIIYIRLDVFNIMYYRLLQFRSGKGTSMWNIQVAWGPFARTKRRSRTANEPGCRTNHQSLSKRNWEWSWLKRDVHQGGWRGTSSFFFFFRFNRGFKANSEIYPGSICKRKTGVLCVIFSYFFFRQVGISKCTISGNPDFGMSRMSPEWIQGSFRVQRNSCPRNMTIFC